MVATVEQLRTRPPSGSPSIWRTPDQDRRAPLRRLEISFSQGAEWKTLISKYIGTIPLSGDASCAAEQSISGGPPPRTPVSSAMMAKVGAAARDSQSAAPRAAAWPLPARRPRFHAEVDRAHSSYSCRVDTSSRAAVQSPLHRASILIVPAHPLHREFEAVLITAFRHKVEVMVGTVDHIDAARSSRNRCGTPRPSHSCRRR